MLINDLYSFGNPKAQEASFGWRSYPSSEDTVRGLAPLTGQAGYVSHVRSHANLQAQAIFGDALLYSPENTTCP